MEQKPILVFQTDFTYKEGAVSSMYGVVKSVDRAIEIMDGTHEIPQYDIWSASYRLYQTVRFWPKGTIFVSVVDPGVGTSRKASVAKTEDGYFIVTPDNGTLTHIDRSSKIIEVREIDETVNRLRGKGTEETSVFHGRDVFAYCAARLASGVISFEGVGESYPIEDIVRFPLKEATHEDGVVEGYFEIGDPNFGNLWTNIPVSLFQEAGFRYGETLLLSVRNGDDELFRERIRYEKAFGDVDRGDLVIYTNELMHVALAVSMGSVMSRYQLGYGSEWEVEFSR